ncbi:putative oxidoreductase TDA3 [Drosera capensis]
MHTAIHRRRYPCHRRELSGVAGCYVATGHSCRGILNAPATGAALAELILNGRSSIVDLSPFSPARFRKSEKRWKITCKFVEIFNVLL